MSSESERATRRRRIDPKLAAAGWSVVPAGSPDSCAPGLVVAEYETANGPVDYALLDGGERAAAAKVAVSDVRGVERHGRDDSRRQALREVADRRGGRPGCPWIQRRESVRVAPYARSRNAL